MKQTFFGRWESRGDKHEVGQYIINVYDSSNERLRSLCLPSTTAR